MFHTSFRPHNGFRIRQTQIRWTIPSGPFWRARGKRTKKYASRDALKEAIKSEWIKMPQDHIRAACNPFFDRLKAIVKAKGGHIELKSTE